ncbi:PKD-like domain-containing protein [Catalinimonas alkaloidigena]|uniref:PKD-like domain-containing protein n=1 Tax=Catalinimonas alkaloidigena TaxID=1075417 RepID=UPI002404EA9F|nr:PKD-like domain-containing protein [Catalinimonas alkaloidigena]
MKNFSKILFALLFFGLLSEVNAQNCPTGGGGYIIQSEQLCADQDVQYQIIYPNLKTYNDNKVNIDWGDGTVEEFDLVQNGSMWEYNAHHTYPQGLGDCIYTARASAYVNGTECEESIITKDVIVWDTDDVLGEGLQPNVETYYVCAGNSINVSFEDLTQFTCLDPEHPDNLGRWVEWEYGTANTITGDVKIGGQTKTFPFKEAAEPVWLDPTATSSNVSTLNISVPNTSKSGEFFELTLHNWNSCNPYKDSTGVLTGIPSVSKTVYIRVTNGAHADFEIDNNPACVDNPVLFTNKSSPGMQYEWDFGDSSTSTDVSPTKTYSAPGDYTVSLKVTNTSVTGNTGTCFNTVYKTITILPQPVADFDISPSGPQCGNTNVTLSNTSTNTPSGTTWNWEIRREKTDGQLVDLNGSATAGFAATTEDITSSLPYFGSKPTATYYVKLYANTPNACSDESGWKTLVVNANVGTPVFSSPVTSLCQGNNTTQYNVTATNVVSYLWELTPATAGSISNTGEVSWNSSFSGAATVKVTAKGCGADKSESVNVTVTPAVGDPDPISGDEEVCQGISSSTYSTLASDAISYEWTLLNAGSSSISGSSTSAVVSWDPSFVGTAMIIVRAEGCNGFSAPDTLSVEVIQSPQLDNPASDYEENICSGETASFTPSVTLGGSSFKWTTTVSGSISGVTTSGDQLVGSSISDVLTNSGTITGTVTYHITPYKDSCEGETKDFTVTVNPGKPDDAGIISGPTPAAICEKESGIDFSVAAITNAKDYIWTLPAGASITSGDKTNTITVDFGTVAAGNHVVEVYGENGCGIGASSSFNIEVKPNPDLIVNVTNSEICHEEEAIATLSSSPAFTGTLYSWTIESIGADITGASNESNQTELRQQLSNTGIAPQDITYRITPVLNGCEGDYQDVTFTVNPSPVLTISPTATTLCNGKETDISLSANVSGTTTYNWTAIADEADSLSGFSDGTGDEIKHTLVNTSSKPQKITYTITPTAYGCDGDSKTVEITVQPTPVLTTTVVASAICTEEDAEISLSSNVVGTTFEWTVSSDAGITGAAPGSGSLIQQTLENTTSAPKAVTYTITPKFNGCEGASQDITITVNPKPDLQVTNSSPEICDGEQTNVSLSSLVSGTIISWTASYDATYVSGVSDDSGTKIEQTLSNSSNVVQTVTYHITTEANGCSGESQDIEIKVKPTPILTLNYAGTVICSKDKAEVVFSSSVASGMTYSWTVDISDPSKINGAFPGSGSGFSQTLTNSGTSPVDVTYKVTPSANGCSGEIKEVTFTVNPTISDAVAGGDAELCGLNYDMSATTPAVGSGKWTFVSGPGTASFDDENAPNANVTVSTSGIYTFRWTVSGVCGGSNMNDVTLNFKDYPTTSDISGPTEVCVNSSDILYYVDWHSGSSYSWSVSPDNADAPEVLSSNQIAVLNFGSNPWSGELIVTETNDGCTAPPKKIAINAYSIPVADAGDDQTICANSTTTLGGTPSASGGSGDYSYQWSPTTDLDDANSANPTVTLSSNRTYTLKVTDLNTGCISAIDEVKITVKPQLEAGLINGTQSICSGTAPAAFTQNPASGGDGAYTYQWQISSDGGATYADITGADDELYKENSTLTATTYYRRKVTDGVCGEKITDPIKVTVEPPLTAGTIGTDDIIVAGDTPNKLINIADAQGGSGLQYKWQKSTNGGSTFTDIVGTNSAEYQPGALFMTTVFRRVAFDGVCTDIASNTVTIEIEDAAEAGTIEEDQLICINSVPAPITQKDPATGGVGSFDYRWLYSEDGTNFTVISSENDINYTPVNPLDTTTYYKREVKSGTAGSWVSSNTIIVTVEPELDPGVIGGTQTICEGSNPSAFTEEQAAKGGSGQYGYQWKFSTDPSPGRTYTDIPFATNKLYDEMAPLSDTTYYVREVRSRNGACDPALSNVIVVYVNPALETGTITGEQTICENTRPFTFTQTEASGGNDTLVYQWQRKINNGDFVDIPGADAKEANYTEPDSLVAVAEQITKYTYRRKVTGGVCGYDFSNEIVVTVEPTLNPGDLTGDQVICAGSQPNPFPTQNPASGGSGSYSYQWQKATGNGAFANIDGAESADYIETQNLSDTTYYRRKVFSGECGEQISDTIRVVVLPALDPGSIAEDQAVVLLGTPDKFTEVDPVTGGDPADREYVWQYSSSENGVYTSISSSNSKEYQVTGKLTQTTYYRRGVKSGNCDTFVYTEPVEVIVQTTLLPGAIGGEQTICEGGIPNNIVETVPASGGDVNSYLYRWKYTTDPNEPYQDIDASWVLDPEGQELQFVQGLMDTTYFKREVKSGAYLWIISEDSMVINVQPALQPGSVKIEGADEVCFGDTLGTFEEETAPQGGSGSYEYQWMYATQSGGPYQTIAGATDSVFQAAATLAPDTYYYVRKVISGECDDVLSNELVVTVHELPNVSLASSVPDNIICQWTEVTFTAGGADIYEFFLNGVSVQGPSANNMYITDSLVNMDEVYVVGTDEKSCNAASSSITTLVNDLPTASIEGSTDICKGSQTGLTLRMTGNIPMEVVYTDGIQNYTLKNLSYETILNVKPSVSTTYTLLSVKDANGCAQQISDQEAVVNVGDPVAEFSIQGDNPACNPQTLIFVNENIQEGVSYTWSWGDGTEDVVTTASDSAEIEHTFVNYSNSRDMTFQVTLTATHESIGCTDRAVSSVHVYPSPEVRVEADKQEGCGPLLVNFFNKSFGVDGHRWYYRVKGTDQVLEETASKNASYILPNTTSETITYEVVYEASLDKCPAQPEIIEVVVHPELEPFFTVTPAHQNLPNSTVSISNQTNEGDWDYHWDFGDGNTSTEKDPASHTYEDYGQYIITLTVSNGACEKQYEERVMIDIDPSLPFVEFNVDTHEGCGPLTVTFTNASNYVNPATFQWNFGDGTGASGVEHPIHTYDKPGKYSVKLEAVNIFGEHKVIMKKFLVEVYDQPTAIFSAGPPTVYLPDRPIATVNQSTGATAYEWHFGDGTVSNEFEPTHIYTEEGLYDVMLIAFNDSGCSDTLLIERLINVKKPEAGKTRIPNSFTPNPDGSNGGNYQYGDVSNDIFIPIIDGVSDMSMTIYNRWGKVMFTSKSKNIGWDGYYEGQLCPADVYYYKIELNFSNGERKTEYGDVTLIR